MISVSTATDLSRDWRVSTSTYLILVMKIRISWASPLISRFENVKRMMESLNDRSADSSANNRRRRTTHVTSVNEESYSVQTNVSSECIMYYIRVFITTYLIELHYHHYHVKTVDIWNQYSVSLPSWKDFLFTDNEYYFLNESYYSRFVVNYY